MPSWHWDQHEWLDVEKQTQQWQQRQEDHEPGPCLQQWQEQHTMQQQMRQQPQPLSQQEISQQDLLIQVQWDDQSIWKLAGSQVAQQWECAATQQQRQQCANSPPGKIDRAMSLGIVLVFRNCLEAFCL